MRNILAAVVTEIARQAGLVGQCGEFVQDNIGRSESACRLGARPQGADAFLDWQARIQARADLCDRHRKQINPCRDVGGAVDRHSALLSSGRLRMTALRDIDMVLIAAFSPPQRNEEAAPPSGFFMGMWRWRSASPSTAPSSAQ